MISACQKHVGATRPSPFKVRDNQRPDHIRCRENLRLSLSPAITCPGEGGESIWTGYGSPSVLNEVSHEFSTAMRFESANDPCKNSFRPDSSLTTTFNQGRKTSHPLTTPDMPFRASCILKFIHMIENSYLSVYNIVNIFCIQAARPSELFHVRITGADITDKITGGFYYE